jgi:hypothetical protein
MALLNCFATLHPGTAGVSPAMSAKRERASEPQGFECKSACRRLAGGTFAVLVEQI